jgi:hypothetical protein
MNMNDIHHVARRLLNTHGDKAELAAAQKAAECDRQRDEDEARDWRRIQAAISQMRGPLAS